MKKQKQIISNTQLTNPSTNPIYNYLCGYLGAYVSVKGDYSKLFTRFVDKLERDNKIDFYDANELICKFDACVDLALKIISDCPYIQLVFKNGGAK